MSDELLDSISSIVMMPIDYIANSSDPLMLIVGIIIGLILFKAITGW